MDHEVSIIARILEILEIEVSNILYYPGHMGGERAAPGVRLRGLGLFCHYFWNMFLEFLDILEMLEMFFL